MKRKWRRCQCTIHACKYRAKPDSDFCDECEFNPPYCAAMYEKERLPKGGVFSRAWLASLHNE
jgi:hypothetical protein